MKALFITLGSRYGHMNPMMDFASSMHDKGWDIVFPSVEMFRQHIEERHFTYVDSLRWGYGYERANPFTIINAGLTVLSVANRIMPDLLRFIKKEKFDLIVYDRLTVWGRIAADEYSIPCISTSVTPVINLKVIRDYGLLSEVNGNNGIEDFLRYPTLIKEINHLSNLVKNLTGFDIFKLFINPEANLNLVYTSRYVQPSEYLFGDNYIFHRPKLGIKEVPVLNENINEEAVFCSFGTTFTDNFNIYKNIVDLFILNKRQLIISIPNKFAKELHLDSYKNIIYGEHLPQIDILSKVKLFITHGGFNSFNESISAEVPIVVLPQMIEQKINGMRAEELNIGILVKDFDEIKDAITRLDNEYESYKKSIKIASQSLDAGPNINDIIGRINTDILS